MNTFNPRFLFIVFLLVTFHSKTYSISSKRKALKTDTLLYSYAQLEGIFIKNNFQLLSQKYNIAMKEAAIQQARLYTNPNVFYENVLYDPNNHTWFENNPQYGQRQAQIQQVILIGGKRSQLIKLAESDKNIEQYAFYDLLRSLRFQLISDYALVYFDLEKLTLLSNERDKLVELLGSFRLQFKLGSVSGYEVTRVEFEYNSLKNDINNLVAEIAEAQTRLKVMTHITSESFIKPSDIIISNNDYAMLSPLIDSAFNYRPDLKMAENNIHLKEHSLKYERANAIPNLTFGGNYDRLASAFRNYTGVNVTVALPLFNRNQGNIKMAGIDVDNSKLLYEFNRTTISQEVQEAYTKFSNSKVLYNSITEDYKKRINSISSEAITRFDQRIINLLDFVDKIRTYKSGRLSIIDIELNYFITCHYLNYVTNTRLF